MKAPMSNKEINTKFLEAIGWIAASMILNSIAKHYGSSVEIIREEVTGNGAQNILDYMIEPERSAAYVLYQKHGFAL